MNTDQKMGPPFLDTRLESKKPPNVAETTETPRLREDAPVPNTGDVSNRSSVRSDTQKQMQGGSIIGIDADVAGPQPDDEDDPPISRR